MYVNVLQYLSTIGQGWNKTYCIVFEENVAPLVLDKNERCDQKRKSIKIRFGSVNCKDNTLNEYNVWLLKAAHTDNDCSWIMVAQIYLDKEKIEYGRCPSKEERIFSQVDHKHLKKKRIMWTLFKRRSKNYLSHQRGKHCQRRNVKSHHSFEYFNLFGFYH